MDDRIITAKELTHDFVDTGADGEETTVVRALDAVDVDVNKGEFIAVIGGNGSGKSTFARHLNALLRPTKGTLYVEGMDTAREEDHLSIRGKVGMVFQNPDNQIIGTIVDEDVAFGPENLGVPTEEIIERVKESLEAVDMTKYASASPNRLSGGQKQRVAVAGVLAMEPDVIVLDEATAMLDPRGRREVLSVVKKLNKEKNITVILITHYMDEAAQADRIIILDKAKVIRTGTPKEIFSDVESLRSLRLEVPKACELAWKLRDLGVELPQGIINEKELVDAILKENKAWV